MVCKLKIYRKKEKQAVYSGKKKFNPYNKSNRNTG